MDLANEIYTSLSGQNDRLSLLLRQLSTFAVRDRQKYDRTMESLSREKIGTGMSSLEARDVDRDVVDGLQEVAKVMAVSWWCLGRNSGRHRADDDWFTGFRLFECL